MNEDEIVPTRFAPVVDALNETLSGLSGRADRAELLAVLMRSFELWVTANVAEEPSAPSSRMATEHETVETLAQAMRNYWVQCNRPS
jgi:hypothetical protein